MTALAETDIENIYNTFVASKNTTSTTLTTK